MAGAKRASTTQHPMQVLNAVVLGHGDDDFIALMQKIHAVAVGDEVQALRRVLGEHDLVVLCVKKITPKTKVVAVAMVSNVLGLRAPVALATRCHGTMLEWCSATEMTISSPSCRKFMHGG